MGVIGAAPDKIGLAGDLAHARIAEPSDDAFDLAHDLRADAVAGEQKQIK